MNALVVYHSQFGNTRQVGEAIAEVFQGAGRARTLSADRLTATELQDVDLVVMGTPTHKMNLPLALRPVFEELPRRILFPGTGALQELDERAGAAIHDGHLRRVDVDTGVVDPQPGQAGEQVLDRRDALALRYQAGGQGGVADIGGHGGDEHQRVEVDPPERNRCNGSVRRPPQPYHPKAPGSRGVHRPQPTPTGNDCE